MIITIPLSRTIVGISLVLLSGCSSVSALKEKPQTVVIPASVETQPKDKDIASVVQKTESNIIQTIDVVSSSIINGTSNGESTNSSTITKTYQPKESVKSTRPENPVQLDLWQRLRRNFTLEQPKGSEEDIQKFEKWFSDHPEYFERLAERAYWFMPYILDEIEKRGMPAELALLPAIESAYRPDATSRSHAVGIWQMISATGKRFGLRQDWWMDGRRDVVHSTRAALDYLEYLSQEFDQNWELALAGYNAGEGNIRKAIRKNSAANKATNYASLNLRRETEEYVPKLFAVRNIILNPDKYNLVLNTIPNHHTLRVVDAKVQTDLTVAASLISISPKRLQYLNMGYKRGVTPPAGPHLIVVPSEKADQLSSELNQLSHQQRMRWAKHRVRKGEYLGKIARKHGVTVDSIIKANEMSSNLIQSGQELKIPLSSGNYQYAKATASDVKTQDGDQVYTIRSGDTLWKISQRVDITLSKLLRWNGISKRAILRPGQRLIVGRSS